MESSVDSVKTPNTGKFMVNLIGKLKGLMHNGAIVNFRLLLLC